MVGNLIRLAFGAALASACASGRDPIAAYDGHGTTGSSVATMPDPAEPYHIEPDPPLNWVLSPHTGWTRAHHEALFGRLCRGFATHLSPGGARTVYGGDTSWPGALEGVARILPAIGAWLSDPANPSIIEYDGEVIDLVAVTRTALVNGTDPEHAEYWGEIGSGTDQRKIEAASVAEFLLLSRTRVWDTMPTAECDQLMAWLREGSDVHASNRALFEVIRNTARRTLGYPADPTVIADYLDQVDSYYVGDGWYADGEETKLDWYTGFVFQPELLFWAWIDGGSDEARRERVVTRARAYLHHLPHFFDERGGHVAFGRSLAYRSAMLAPLALAELLGVSPLEHGLARRLASGSMAYFLAGGPRSAAGMLDADDVLRRGFLDEDPRICEGYVRSGSPYYTTRSLLFLALPRDHAFWTVRELPGPADGLRGPHVLPGPGFSLHQHRGWVSLLPARSWNPDMDGYPAKYGRLAYSSGFFLNQQLEPPDEGLVDAGLAVVEFGRRLPRGRPRVGEVAHGFAYTSYNTSGSWSNYDIDSASMAVEDGLVRLSCVDGPAGPSGFVVEEASHYLGGAGPFISVADDGSWEHAQSGQGWIFARRLLGHVKAPGFVAASDVNSVFDEGGEILSTTPPQNDGAFCFATAQLAGVEPEELDDLVARSFAVEMGADERAFMLAGPRGELAFVSLRNEPLEQVVAVNGIELAGPLRYARVSADGGTVDGLGVLSIRDSVADRTLLSTDAPILVRLTQVRSGRWSVEISGPADLRPQDGSPAGVFVLDVDDERYELTGDVIEDGLVRIPGPLHSIWSRDLGVSLMRLNLEY